MGILISAIAAPSRKLHERRLKKKNADKAAGNQENRPVRPLRSPEQSQTRSPPQVSEAEPVRYELSGTAIEQERQNLGHQQPVELEGTAIGTARSATPEPTSVDTQPRAKMASDEDYMSFLNKANEDPSAGSAKTSSKSTDKPQFKATDAGADIPKELKIPTDNEEWIYVSDADEPFVAVSLKLSSSKLPDEKTFAKLINHPDPSKAEIEIQDVTEWDSRGQYTEVVEATRKAVKGSDVRVYKVPKGSVEVEYWVVGVEGGRLVGVKALAVES